jgi:hypothetical protein
MSRSNAVRPSESAGVAVKSEADELSLSLSRGNGSNRRRVSQAELRKKTHADVVRPWPCALAKPPSHMAVRERQVKMADQDGPCLSILRLVDRAQDSLTTSTPP